MKKCYDLAVVGGGASGLIAALRAKALGPELAVCLLEKQDRVGRKLLSTGNGRCNLTNLGASATCYHGGGALVCEALRRFPPRRVMDFFEEIGLPCREEEDGRVYPLCGQAAAVLDDLRLGCQERGVETMINCEVTALTPGFVLSRADGQSLSARRVLLATGGLAAPGLGGGEAGQRLFRQAGHRVTRCFPALSQLKTPADLVRPLKGVRCAAQVDLLVAGAPARRERGEILFAEYGLSGIAAMQLARAAGEALARRQRVQARINFLPGLDGDLSALLGRRAQALPERALEDFLTGLVHKRLGQTLIKLAGVAPLSRPARSLAQAEIAALAALLCGWTLPVTGTMGFAQAQVTAGGAECGQFDPLTLESILLPGLYAAGEALDVDGDCGGFNLQWAWASGLLAAESAVRSLMDEGSETPCR